MGQRQCECTGAKSLSLFSVIGQACEAQGRGRTPAGRQQLNLRYTWMLSGPPGFLAVCASFFAGSCRFELYYIHGVSVCRGVDVEVRGHVMRAGSLLPSRGPRARAQVLTLGQWLCWLMRLTGSRLRCSSAS